MSNITPQKFKKLAIFTDIHFGRRSNSRIHNQDCLDFVLWFCDVVSKDLSYTHVCFLGDWFENRSTVNIETLEMSYKSLKALNSLGIPVYFVVGNHDLYQRTTRDLYSTRMFGELSNFKVVDRVIIEDGLLFSPYLFEDEYKELTKHLNLWAWLGHFEFRNFVVTGLNTVLGHGPDHTQFSGPKKILSGHFHKRQQQDNVVYVGNTFPMDFGDVDDQERGMCTYDVLADKLSFEAWPEAPSFMKVNLSDVINGNFSPEPRARVKCLADVKLSFLEAQELREGMVETFQLRDFSLTDDRTAIQEVLEGDNLAMDDSVLQSVSIDELVIKQLKMIEQDANAKVEADMLVALYQDLPIELTENAE